MRYRPRSGAVPSHGCRIEGEYLGRLFICVPRAHRLTSPDLTCDMKVVAFVNSKSLSCGLCGKWERPNCLGFGSRGLPNFCVQPGIRGQLTVVIKSTNFVGSQAWLKSSVIAYLTCDLGHVNYQP